MKDILYSIINNIFLEKYSFLIKIFLIILLLIWLIKNLINIKKKKYISCITVISKFSINSNKEIIILEIEGIRLVLGITLNNINLLYIIPCTVNQK